MDDIMPQRGLDIVTNTQCFTSMRGRQLEVGDPLPAHLRRPEVHHYGSRKDVCQMHPYIAILQ